MKRLGFMSLAGLLLYLAAEFECTLPLSQGFQWHMQEEKIRAARQPGPKILLLSGSNGLFSHSAKVIEEELGIRSVNLALTAELHPAYLLFSYLDVIEAGDIVVLPLEFNLFSTKMVDSSSTLQFLINYDRGSLNRLGAEYWLRALISKDFFYLMRSLAEHGALLSGASPAYSMRDINEHGDFQGHTPERAGQFRRMILAQPERAPATVERMTQVDGTEWIRKFILELKRRGVRVFASFPTLLRSGQTRETPELAWIRRFYDELGVKLLLDPDDCLYPLEMMYDSNAHLNSEGQTIHSRKIAKALRRELALPR